MTSNTGVDQSPGTDVGTAFTDYNMFWAQYVMTRAGRSERAPSHSRLARDGTVSHAALTQRPFARPARGEEDEEPASTAPSPFDYIASVMKQQDQRSAPTPTTEPPRQASVSVLRTPSKGSSPTPRRWDVQAAKSALCDAAKALRNSSSPRPEEQVPWEGSVGGVTSSRGASTLRLPDDVSSDREVAGNTQRTSPVYLASPSPPRAGYSHDAHVPRQLFVPDAPADDTDDAVQSFQEINLSDVSVAMSSDAGDEDDNRPPVALRAPQQRPQAHHTLFDVDADISSRHGNVMPPSRKTKAATPTAGLSSPAPHVTAVAAASSLSPEEEATLWQRYGAVLRPEEWQSVELRSFLAFREAQAAQRAALYSRAALEAESASATGRDHATGNRTSQAPATTTALFRLVYAANGVGRRPAAAYPSNPRAPAVFVAPPLSRCAMGTDAPTRPDPAGGVLTPVSGAARFVEWIATEVDIYLDLVLPKLGDDRDAN